MDKESLIENFKNILDNKFTYAVSLPDKHSYPKLLNLINYELEKEQVLNIELRFSKNKILPTEHCYFIIEENNSAWECKECKLFINKEEASRFCLKELVSWLKQREKERCALIIDEEEYLKIGIRDEYIESLILKNKKSKLIIMKQRLRNYKEEILDIETRILDLNIELNRK